MLQRTMIQLYISDCDEAMKFYQEAFDAKMLGDERGDNNLLVHAEMDVFGQAIAFSQCGGNDTEEVIVNRAIQFCLHFEKGQIEIGRKAYNALKNGAIEISKFSTDNDGYWGEWSFEVIDKYGVYWCLYC